MLNDFIAEGSSLKRHTINFPKSSFLNASFEKQVKVFEEIRKFDVPLEEISIVKIKEVLAVAKKEAWKNLKPLGMVVPIKSADEIQANFESIATKSLCDLMDVENIRRFVPVVGEEIDPNYENIPLLSKHTELPNFPEKFKDLTPESPFTVTKDKHGALRAVKKSSICWYLSNKSKKLSSDRNIRVTEHTIKNTDKSDRNEIMTISRENRVYIKDFFFIQERRFRSLFSRFL